MTLPPPCGTVWFVGAGPGDPDLITVKGRDLIARAVPQLDDNQVRELRAAVSQIHVSDALVDYVQALLTRSR